jgi:citronellol/citronellal dehydrogenase
LSSLGAHVSIVGRKLEKLERVKREIDESNGICSIHECDIRDEDNVVKMVSSIVGKYGKIDGLVNNAGGQFQSPLEQISAKGWDAVVRTNLTGGFIVARECYKQSMKEKGGSIVNIIADMWMVSNYILFFYFF